MLTGWFGQTNTGSRASTEDGGNRSDPDDDTQIMEPDQGNGMFSLQNSSEPPDSARLFFEASNNLLRADATMPTVLSHIISQLRPGADLSRVVLPTFILEPRSMLERITKLVFTCPVALTHLRC